ncbi:MAG: tetraacyldisaccharide 4'-kinase [Bacteroidetes bacterium]|nr:tetraacyldisaccharide 4'-kinase [Bacteroidota bacterium]MBU2584151.1 tetraacyldisaccharide 4'-kinase [Bacteroidota bacterium]
MRLLLLPFSFLFWVFSSIKNFLYDFEIIKSFKVDKKIICIGNITSGGTGKTPITIAIAKALLTRQKKISVLLRGYKRTTKGYYEVNEIDPDKFGDEPVMIFSNLPDVKVIVSEDRVFAARKISESYDVDYILMDDGLQNRKIEKDFTIVVMDEENASFMDKIYLPAGNLRESKNRLRTYSTIIKNYKFKSDQSKSISDSKTFNCKYILDGFYNINNEKIALEKLTGKNVLAFCGIAHPRSFFEMLNQLKLQSNHNISYSDHHYFTADEIDGIIGLMEQKKSELAITTEKDFVRIKKYNNKFSDNGLGLLYTKVSAEIENLDSLINAIIKLN